LEETKMAYEEGNLESEIYLNGSKSVKRTTVYLTEILDENLEALSLTSGDAKGVIIRRALSEHLKNQGMQPHKKPKVSVSY
jgi:5S rRNA maturation endonuclease (ribonuclease M5)